MQEIDSDPDIDFDPDDIWGFNESSYDEGELPNINQSEDIKVAPYLEDNKYIIRKVNYEDVTYEVFNKRIRNTHPVIIQGFVSTWPAMEKWKSTEYLADLFGKKNVTNFESKDNLNFFKSELTIHHTMEGSKMVDLILNHPSEENEKKWYCRGGFRKRFLGDVLIPYDPLLPPEEASKLAKDKFSFPFRQHNCTVWVGTKGNITPFHYDLSHGFLCHIKGRKVVTFYHKDDYKSVYPNPYSHINRTASKLIYYKKF